ncbi:hypothetical protein DKG74_20795 [Zavarzinia aquatilis]|uniref:Uncharacterized protein n=1 Tax=Zavarzinia aquatilis TaxID=2211142 RepID=A0A317DSJ9_9PROT|nr:hypothetical protein DKG74_20795 [Zavarzinia aquatilis]
MRALLLMPLLSMTGCAGAVVAVEPPACPVAGDAVADELAAAGGCGALPATCAWLGRMKAHCDKIEVLRGG